MGEEKGQWWGRGRRGHVVDGDGTFEDDSPQRDGAEIEPYLALPTVMPELGPGHGDRRQDRVGETWVQAF